MPPTPLTDVLPRLCYGAGPLVAVEHAVLDRDPGLICAVRLTFEALAVVLRAVPEDDTIAAAEGVYPSAVSQQFSRGIGALVASHALFAAEPDEGA